VSLIENLADNKLRSLSDAKKPETKDKHEEKNNHKEKEKGKDVWD
jgi:hypothetical protein